MTMNFIFIGGILAGISFIISAFVEINLESTYAVLPNWGEAQLRIFNGRNCDYLINTNIPYHAEINLPAFDTFENRHIQIDGENSTFTYSLSSSNCPGDAINTANFVLNGSMATSFHFTGVNTLSINQYEDSPEKSRRGWPLLTVLGNLQSNNAFIRLIENGKDERYNETAAIREQRDIQANRYDILIDTLKIGEMELRLGGVYTLMITQTGSSLYHIELITVTEPNSLSKFIDSFALLCGNLLLFLKACYGLYHNMLSSPWER